MTDQHLDPTPAEAQVATPADAEPPVAPPIAGFDTRTPSAEPVPPVPPMQHASHPVPPAPPAAPDHSHGIGPAVLSAALVSLLVASIAGLAGGYIGARLVLDDSGDRAAAPTTAAPIDRSAEPVAAAAAAAVPSIVNVDVSSGTASGGESGLPRTHPDVPNSGTGSGVAFKKAEGGGTYVLTNNHVVADATNITVRDVGGDSVKATLVGADPETDIAVIKVSADLPVIDIGDSADLAVGQTVVAIGSPYGLEHSVTSGIISAIGRSLPDFSESNSTYPLVDVIQTDASINPGNSGGALVDRQGRLIGINTAIYTDTGSSGGIGFAIPVNTAVRVAGELMDGGSVTHPFLGVVGQDVDQALAATKGLSVTEGAYVVSVMDGTGAKKAGVKAGDVIIALDAADIRSMDDLLLQVRRHKVGDVVTLTIERAGKTMKLEMTVGDKPADVTAPSTETTPPTQ